MIRCRTKYPCHAAVPTSMNLKWRHNHPVMSADVLRRRDVSPAVADKFKELFAAGHSPSSALETHKCDLQLDDEDSYIVKAADRFHCPDLQWCYRLYYKLFKAEYGTQSGESMASALMRRLESWNGNQSNTVAVHSSNEDHCIAICTPLMKRVHQRVIQSSELVFVDSSGSLDTSNYRVFMLMTNCSAGGLPLGIFVTTSESESVLVSGLELLKTVFPTDCFHGRDTQGPMYFMTDDCAAERNALAKVFPNSVVLLCQFHVLWAAWRWLWKSSNGVRSDDRPYLYGIIRRAVFAHTSQELAEALTAMHHDVVAVTYDKFICYCNKLVEKSELWAACYRGDAALRGHSTNNTVESSIRILKDKIFKRLKAFNLVQLTDFLVTRLEQYYSRRLANIANNRTDELRHTRYFPKDSDIALANVWQVSPDIVSVPSATTADVSYSVNTSLWVCSCPAGNGGAPCKHQWAAANKYSIDCFNFLPITSPALRKLYHYIACGRDDMPDDWFVGLKDNDGSAVEPTVRVVTDTQQDRQLSRTSVVGVDYSDEQVEEAVTQLGRITATLTDKLRQDRATYLDGVMSFVRNFDNITTTSGLMSAMHCFGKYSGAATALSAGRKRKAAVAFANKRIGVQPTAVARRSVKCFGRRVAGLGRPSKLTRSSEHGYGKVGARPVGAGLPPRKTAAPHNLQECVSRRVSLGK